MTKTNSNSDKQLRLYQIFSAKLVLEVMGGAGAIWGFSEAVGLRVPSTIWLWRPCALAVGAIFFVRWMSQIRDYVSEEDITKTNSNSEKQLRLYQIFIAKLVLEVMGGAGAIWGFSEAVGLRVPSTIWLWRPCALAVGAIFFMRWMAQIRDHVLEEDIQLFERKAASVEDGERAPLAPQKVYS